MYMYNLTLLFSLLLILRQALNTELDCDFKLRSMSFNFGNSSQRTQPQDQVQCGYVYS